MLLRPQNNQLCPVPHTVWPLTMPPPSSLRLTHAQTAQEAAERQAAALEEEKERAARAAEEEVADLRASQEAAAAKAAAEQEKAQVGGSGASVWGGWGGKGCLRAGCMDC